MSLNRTVGASEYAVDRLISSAYIGVNGFFGITLNLLLAILIVINMLDGWTPVNVILLNLAIGDLLVAALETPVAMMSAITGGWYWSYDMCLRYAWFMTTLQLAGIGDLAAIAIERWLLITRPTKALSIWHTLLLAISVWLYALFLSSPPHFGWGRYGPQVSNVSCGVSLRVHDPATNNDSYIAFLSTFGLIVPLLVITGSFFGIVRALDRTERRSDAEGRRDIKAEKMAALIITALLVAMLCPAALALVTQSYSVVCSPLVAIIPFILAIYEKGAQYTRRE